MHDANGNQITRNGDAVTWNSYKHRSHVENGTRDRNLHYDATANFLRFGAPAW